MTAQRSEWRHTPLHEAASDRSRLQNRTVKLTSIIALGFGFALTAQILKADPADDAYIRQKLLQGLEPDIH
jgi:hypothetical protein